jgi:multiple sugar transport system permease protein
MRTETKEAAVATDTAPALTAPRIRNQMDTPTRRLRSVVKHLLLIVAALTMIYPLIWMVLSSFREGETIFRQPGLVFSDFTLENYINGWTTLDQPFNVFLLNSTIISLACIVGNIVSCSLAAYAFARLNFTFKPVLFGMMLVTIMLPIHVLIVPQYIVFSQIDLVNTFWPLILPKLLATDAFFVFLMVQFIRGLPRELDEAATIDGCGHFAIFFRILLPLMVPAIATTAIFTFIWTWNDFFTSLIYLTRMENYTVQLAIRAFMDSAGQSNWGAMFAMSVVSLVPIFLVFLFGQRFLVRGIATTGIK